MNKLLFYLLESSICLAVFYTVYQAFLKRETYYHLKRGYLLFSILFSMLVPLLNISLQSVSASGLMMSFHMEPLLVTAYGGNSMSTQSIGIREIIGLFYLSMVLLLIIRVSLNFRAIHRLYRRGKRIHGRQYNIIVHSMNHPPFSFFRSIFISDKHYSHGKLDDILEHEKTHVRQLHTVDMILAELIIILQWFNPMAWLYKNIVTENHEFLADEAVINRGFSPEAYQLRILAQLFGIRSMPAAHNFNQSLTQKRLKMMEKSKSPAVSRLKILMILPAAIMLFYMFACSSGQADLSAQDAPDTDKKYEVYYQVDEAAEPDGGVMAFRQYIAENIRYPEQARKNGVQGRIYIQFIVDEHGKLVTAVESSEVPSPPPPPEKDASGDVPPPPPPPPPPDKIVLDGVVVVGYKPPQELETEYSGEDVQLLADEAVRVIIESDLKWKPAMKDGKPVKSAWTIPIVFKLD